MSLTGSSNCRRSGATLQEGLRGSKHILRSASDHFETLSAIEKAENIAAAGCPSPKQIERIGKGWVAEEALAIALYSVLATPTLEEAVILAVNHSGDSDSTGAIAGNIAGTHYGAETIPTRWISQLELLDVITAVADDLWALAQRALDFESDAIWRRYPGW